MKIAVGSDHAAFSRKSELIEAMLEWGHDVKDFGSFSVESVDYPDYAKLVCAAVASGEYDRGILVCGTGIGMSIAANKIKGIRCAVCSESYSARLTRLHNDSNVLSMGARTLGIEISLDILKTFLDTEFPAEERNMRRIAKVMAFEDEQ